ncbi:MAG: helix-turn-helix transcriptional regulator [Cyclobacteriaceae bacterium]
MFTREELLRSPEYWFEEAQNELFRQVVEYKERKGINQTQLAKELGVTKGYVSQILKGEFNYTLKKLIEISLAIGQVPKVEYGSLEKIIEDDSKSQFLHLQTSQPVFITLPASHHSFEQKGEAAEPVEAYSYPVSTIA